jgi:hypothetical protein
LFAHARFDHVEGDDASRRPLPPWLLWVWRLALVVEGIAVVVASAVLSLVGAPFRILHWLMDHHRGPAGSSQ